MNIAASFLIGGYALKKINQIIKNKKKSDKYDKCIEEKIKSNNEKNKNEHFKLGHFESSRKIPNKKELNKVYDKFIKNINNIKDIKKEEDIQNNDYHYLYKKKNLMLNHDDYYLLFKLNLNPDKSYILNLKFDLQFTSNISFLFKFENDKYKSFKIDKEKVSNQVQFNMTFTPCKNNLLYSSEFYILFDAFNRINLKNIDFEKKESKKKSIHMTIIKSKDILVF